MDQRIELRAIDDGTRGAAWALLRANDLPTDDLDASISLTGAFIGEELVGVVGLQRCGDVGLLRSLAVTPSQRCHGTARTLCEHVFADAARTGLGELYLLTTTAADYFVRLGFEVIDRDAAPLEVKTTAQFVSLCPSSARVLRRTGGARQPR